MPCFFFSVFVRSRLITREDEALDRWREWCVVVGLSEHIAVASMRALQSVRRQQMRVEQNVRTSPVKDLSPNRPHLNVTEKQLMVERPEASRGGFSEQNKNINMHSLGYNLNSLGGSIAIVTHPAHLFYSREVLWIIHSTWLAVVNLPYSIQYFFCVVYKDTSRWCHGRLLWCVGLLYLFCYFAVLLLIIQQTRLHHLLLSQMELANATTLAFLCILNRSTVLSVCSQKLLTLAAAPAQRVVDSEW